MSVFSFGKWGLVSIRLWSTPPKATTTGGGSTASTSRRIGRVGHCFEPATTYVVSHAIVSQCFLALK